MYRERSFAFFVGSTTLFWILVPTCFSVFINCDQLVSFFSWHLLNHLNTYIFVVASAVQIWIPFRATVIGGAETFGPKGRLAKFSDVGPATWFIAQTAFCSTIAAMAGKASFSLDYIPAKSQFVWPTDLFPRLF